MKKQILTVTILCLMFFVSLLFFCKKDNSKTFRIIKVVEADTFYIDINNNNKPDDDELFKIKNIIALKPLKNPKTEYYAQKLGISVDEYIRVGYLARNLAKTELTNKDVSMILPEGNERYVDINYQGKNLAEILLKDGLAFAYEKSNNPFYFQLQNIKQIKANAKEISSLDFSLVNMKTKIAHKTDSEHFSLIKNGELFLSKHIKYFNFSDCKFCYKKDKNKENTDIVNIQKSKNVYQKSVYKNFDDIELFLINPLENKMPTNSCDTKICKRIIQEINASKDSIDLALYGISKQTEIINALSNAKKRGVKVRAVFDYSNNMDEIYPYSSTFVKDFNAKTDSAKTLMHNKFMIFDDKKVLTGSVNISTSGVGGYNANIAVIINSKDLAKIYKDEFNQMYNGKFSVNKNKFEHPFVNLLNSKVSVYFSPKDNVYKNGILPLIKNAKSKIYVSAFYLTDRDFVSELVSAKKRNVDVMVMLDAVGAVNFKDRIAYLKSAGIPVIVEDWGGKNHEKTIMIDDEYLILGSCNFTISGFYKNDENMLVIQNSKIAEFYADYFLYLFNSTDKKYLKFIPRAESFESKNSCYDGIDNNFDGKIDSEDEGCRK